MPGDAYLSPPELCLAICKHLAEQGVNPSDILEPSAGAGNFVCAARTVWPNAVIHANEIAPDRIEPALLREYLLKCAGLDEGAEPPPLPDATIDTKEALCAAGANTASTDDFLDWNTDTRWSLIIGNPPYTLGGGAAAHAEKAISLLAPGGVLVFVLKMHFFGTKARVGFWDKFPFTAAWPIIPRPDFTGDGRDTVEYCAIAWRKNDDGMLYDKQMFCVRNPIQWAVEKKAKVKGPKIVLPANDTTVRPIPTECPLCGKLGCPGRGCDDCGDGMELMSKWGDHGTPGDNG